MRKNTSLSLISLSKLLLIVTWEELVMEETPVWCSKRQKNGQSLLKHAKIMLPTILKILFVKEKIFAELSPPREKNNSATTPPLEWKIGEELEDLFTWKKLWSKVLLFVILKLLKNLLSMDTWKTKLRFRFTMKKKIT